MKYVLVHASEKREEISHERAVELLKGNYTEKVCTYDELLESVCGLGCVLRIGGGACVEVQE